MNDILAIIVAIGLGLTIPYGPKIVNEDASDGDKAAFGIGIIFLCRFLYIVLFTVCEKAKYKPIRVKRISHTF